MNFKILPCYGFLAKRVFNRISIVSRLFCTPRNLGSSVLKMDLLRIATFCEEGLIPKFEAGSASPTPCNETSECWWKMQLWILLPRSTYGPFIYSTGHRWQHTCRQIGLNFLIWPTSQTVVTIITPCLFYHYTMTFQHSALTFNQSMQSLD